MLLELHVLQNVAPANLNRDDTGAPKSCVFGDFRRARVSSQSWKRAMRIAFTNDGVLPVDQLAVRTKRVAKAIADGLSSRDRPGQLAEQIATALLQGAELSVGADGKTQYLLFLGRDEIARLIELADLHWDILASVVAPTEAGKRGKKTGRDAVPAEIRQQTLAVLDGGRAADLALFGRMLADLPERNVDGAAQVAHAISTHAVDVEFDFYTAVDDLRPEDTEGADMLGTVEFVSACLYRYANLDLTALTRNLQGDGELALASAEAFARAFVTSLPAGKQQSMAAQNPPSYALAVVRERDRWSLANAFLQPMRSTRDADLMASSIAGLSNYWTRLTAMYGDDSVVAMPLLIDPAYQERAGAVGQPAGPLGRWLDAIAGSLTHGREQ